MTLTPNAFKIILPLLFLTCQITAQENTERKFAIGIHAAPTYYTLQFNKSAHASEYKPFVGYTAGVSGEFKLSARFSVHAELNYERSGTVFYPLQIDPNIIIDFSHQYVQLTKSICTTNSISLPLSLKFNFLDKKNIRLFANVGSFITYAYNFNYSNTYENGAQEQYTYKRSYKFGKNYDLGLLGGLGADIRLNNRIHLTLEMRDQLNLRSIGFIRRNTLGFFTGLIFQL